MEFYIEKHSSTPVITQIEEQIKWAVMMGIFRNGDTLPSIRDIEKQTGVHHSQIHKAYLALRRSGLVVLTRGKGSVISTATDMPRSIGENCTKLSRQVIAKARQLALSPTAFARYLSRQAQESERISPLISYVDDHINIAEKTAADIAQMWQVPVKGVIYSELKALIAKGGLAQRILVNHVMYVHVCELFPKSKSTFIPVEVRISDQTMKLMAGIKPDSTMLLLHQPQPSHRLHYMIAQIQELLQSTGVKVTSRNIREITDLGALLSSPKYDYYLIGPAVRGDIPQELHKSPRVLPINPQLDPTSLEAARIRAGVVI
jgi:DNA-binding transcriptional regulator YhcF (GntR family)